MYDAIIVGARCAGASTALLLAQRGYRVLLLDRATFPADIPHGHFIHKDGPARLARWGLLQRLRPQECPPVTSFTLDLGDGPLTGRDLVVDGVAFGYAPRRSLLDHALVQAAVEAGAELRDGCAVDALLFDRDRVCGVRGRTRAGAEMVARGGLTIGADGRRSLVARAVGAVEYDVFPTATCWYFSYWSGVVDDGLEVHVSAGRMIFAFPTSGGAFGVFVAWSCDQLAGVRANLEREFMAAIDAVPELAARVGAGSRAERFYGATDLPNFFRRPFGPGWALVGDAGYHKDPYLALGISDALRDAESLVQGIDRGRAPGGDLASSLALYEQQRNDASRVDYQQNLHGARFAPPPPPLMQLRAAIRGNQHAINQFFLQREGRLTSRPASSTASPAAAATSQDAR
jgi:flavin-dependent dehydrogenase